MTTKAYLVSWLGKGKIHWTPLEQASNTYNVLPGFDGPLKAALDLGAENSALIAKVQSILDPTLTKITSIQNAVSVTQNLVALNLGLSITSLALAYKNHLALKQIDRGVKEIKGKFELHFLDRSLEYFLENHKEAIGIIPSVLYSLERDVYVALQEVVDNSKLNLPSYLDHKILTLSSSIRAWNQVVYSAIHSGSIHSLSPQLIDEWISKQKNIANRSPEGGFSDQGLVLQRWEHFLIEYQEDKSWFNFGSDKNLMEKALSKDVFVRSKNLIELAREIDYCSRLNHSLSDKMENQEEPVLVLEAS